MFWKNRHPPTPPPPTADELALKKYWGDYTALRTRNVIAGAMDKLRKYANPPPAYEADFLKLVDAMTPSLPDFRKWTVADFRKNEDWLTYRGFLANDIFYALKNLTEDLPPREGIAPLRMTLSFSQDRLRLFAHALKVRTATKSMGDCAWYPAFKEPNEDVGITVAHFKGTPFYEFFSMTVPLPFPETLRFSHTHVIGGTGAGKTTLLQNMIAHDLKSDAAVIIIDPHRVLVPTMAALKLDRRVLVVSPSEPLGINIFDVKRAGSDAEKDRTFANVSKLLGFMFQDAQTPLTGKQKDAFHALCNLILVFPETRGCNGTVWDMYQYLLNPADFGNDIAHLDDLDRDIFKDLQSKNPEYRRTADEIKYKLRAILKKSSLKTMFSAQKSELDFHEEVEQGSLILIDADIGELGEFTSLYGKIFLELIMQAARRRDPLKKHRPCFLYVDECHHFMDEQAHTLLTDARKHQVGCVFAHQDMTEITSATVKGALMATAIKFAGGVVPADARALADAMRTTHEFILGQPEYHFAAYVKNKTPSAVSITPRKEPFAGFELLDEPRPQHVRVQRVAASVSPEDGDGMSDDV